MERRKFSLGTLSIFNSHPAAEGCLGRSVERRAVVMKAVVNGAAGCMCRITFVVGSNGVFAST